MFKLVIECSKDIDKLQIDFSDGSSVVTHTDGSVDSNSPNTPKSISKNKDKPRKRSQVSTNRNDDLLNTDDDFPEIEQEVVQKPEIPERTGEVKVADEIQNLQI